jgi:hypothetical protein
MVMLVASGAAAVAAAKAAEPPPIYDFSVRLITTQAEMDQPMMISR